MDLRKIDALIGQHIFGDVVPKSADFIYNPKPYTKDWNWMGQVIEKMSALGFYLKTHGPMEPGGLEHAGFTPHGVTGWNGRPDFGATGVTMPIAVGLAALKAMNIETKHLIET